MPAHRSLQSAMDRAAECQRITPQEALDLYRLAPLHALGSAADTARRKRYKGIDHIATYIIDRNINYTNACVTACKFCAFYAPPQSKDVWVRDLNDILRRCEETVQLEGTQIMFQGGHHPDFGVEYYEKIFSAIKEKFPTLVIHSLGASEVEHMARISKVTAEEAVRRLKEAGLDSLAGAGAEMLPARARKAIAPLKESGERWLEIMETAHILGIESTCTMLMGTGETDAERIEHLRMIRDTQDKTGGFRAFIPYTYQPENNRLRGRTQATALEYLRIVAVARIFLDNIPHIQGSWLTTGKEIGQLSLHYGADDLGSVMLEENVVSSAGAKHRSSRMELIHLIRNADRVPAQRSTTYEHLVVHEDPANDPIDDRIVSHVSSIAIESIPGLPRRDRSHQAT